MLPSVLAVLSGLRGRWKGLVVGLRWGGGMRSAILLVEQSSVRLELKKQIEHVEEQQDDRRSVGKHEDVAGFIVLGFARFLHHRIKRGGDDEGRRRYSHQRRHS